MLLVGFLLSSCATVYLAPNGQAIANKHETIAIIKPTIGIEARKKDNPASIKESQRTYANSFQQEIYKSLLKRKTKGQMIVNIQEVDETNSLLEKYDGDATKLSTQKMCDVLGVDAIVTSNFSLSKPMSNGAAIAFLFLGYWGSTNAADVSMSLKNCDDKSLVWKYDHKYRGGLGSSPGDLVDGLMRNASKKTPYFSK